MKSGVQLNPPTGVMYSPLRKAFAAAAFKVFEVWIPSQLKWLKEFAQGGLVIVVTLSA